MTSKPVGHAACRGSSPLPGANLVFKVIFLIIFGRESHFKKL